MISLLHQELDELEDKLLEVEEERKKELFSHELREDEMKEYTKKLMDDFSLLNIEVCCSFSSFHDIDYKSNHSVFDLLLEQYHISVFDRGKLLSSLFFTSSRALLHTCDCFHNKLRIYLLIKVWVAWWCDSFSVVLATLGHNDILDR